MVTEPSATITSVQFRSFKGFQQFSLSLQKMNILTGPNNCGKSTIISALRVLQAGIRRARARKAEVVPAPGQREGRGHPVPEDGLPMSVENVHTDYAETETTVTFRVSNGNQLVLYFPSDGGCFLIPDAQGRQCLSPGSFRHAFPVTIGSVPVLGPVEHEEPVVTEATVRREQSTHRASRHFRSFWHYFPEGFEEFAQLVRSTWPGMDVSPPERLGVMDPYLRMYCSEDRIDRELYWAGFGFQIWCQLLTHICRSREDTMLVIDEPEIYLHPDIQRQLLGILRDTGQEVVIATHSTEIMGEADPSEILIIDKRKRSAQRLRDIEGVQQALEMVGSIQNITLTHMARNRRVVFVEGHEDFRIIRSFAKLLGYKELAAASDLTPLESGGFGAWERIRDTASCIETTLGQPLKIAAIYDRDYCCDEEIDQIHGDLEQHLAFAHFHLRKEVENYLLLPRVLDRAIRRCIHEKARRAGETAPEPPDVHGVLEEISAPMKSDIQGQLVAKRTEFLRHSGMDPSRIAAETLQMFEGTWGDIATRMEIVPGKTMLQGIRAVLQERFGVTLTSIGILESFGGEEVPDDMVDLIGKLEEFRVGVITVEGNRPSAGHGSSGQRHR